MEWTLTEAKTNLSKLLKLANSDGPQIVTLRGISAVVIVSPAEFDRLKAGSPTFAERSLRASGDRS